MKHNVTKTMEVRAGMRAPEYRLKCSCGWEDKVQDATGATLIKAHHEKGHNIGNMYK